MVIEIPAGKGMILTRDYMERLAESTYLPREYGVKILDQMVAHGTAYFDYEDRVYRIGCP